MNEITLNKLRRGYEKGLNRWLFHKLLFVMVLFGSISLNAQIHVGASGTTTSTYFPIYGLYDYSYSQQIVLASEYAAADGIAGPITQIKWKIKTGVSNYEDWNNWTVYLSHTTKTTFSSSTDYVPFADLTQVYSGLITFDGDDTWITVNLATPFVYNGTDNILVAVVENTLGWSTSPEFAAYVGSPSSSYRGLYGYQDDDEIDLTDPSSTVYKSRGNTLAQIQFTGTLTPCATPQNVVITKTHNSAVATWTINPSANLGYLYELRTSGAAGSGTTGLVESGTVAAGVNTKTFNSLLGNTNYTLYLKSNCTGYTPVWGNANNFLTELLLPRPWFEPFNTSTVPAAMISNQTLTNSATIMPGGFTYYYYRNLVGEGATSTTTTMNIGAIVAGDILSFNYGFRNYYVDVPSAGEMEVLISTDYGNTFTNISTIPVQNDLGWQTFEYPLNSYIGQNVKVRIIYTLASGDAYVALDNFYIGPCGLPAVPSVQSVTQTNVVLTWAGNASDNYQIEWGVAGFTQGSGTVLNVGVSGTTINNLTANTTYEYFIRKTCSSGESTWVGRYKFKTTCDPFVGAFSENFSGVATGSSTNLTLPDCWSFYDGGIGYGYVGTTALASPKSFQMYDNGDLINPYILISPETQNLGNGGYRVKFNARSGTSGQTLIFGTMSNPLDASTFTPLQTFALPTTYNVNATPYFVVYLPEGTNDYFAFKHGQQSTYVTIYIDDISYEPNPACPEPVNLSVEKNLSSLTANLRWDGPANIPNNFEVEWGVAPFVQGAGTVVNATNTSTMISSLIADETYSFYVRRICGNESTAWVGPYTFEMGYCTSIPTSNDGTGIGNVTIAGVSMDSPNDVTYEDFTNQVITFNAGEVVPASITFNTGFTYNTNIWVDLNNNGVFENNVELIYQGESLNDNPTTLDVSFTIPDDLGYLTGAYRMRIGTADSGQAIPNSCYSGSWGVTVDLLVNITFPCIQPTNVNFLDIGYEYVVLDWDGQGNSGFELEYGVTGFTQGTGTTILNVTKPYTLENLTPGTTYDFYVRKKCGDLYSDWSTVTTTYVFCDTPEPTGDGAQTLVSDDTLAQLVINGVNLRYYLDPTLTTEVPASTVLQSSGVYYVTQTINCQSDAYLIVDVTVLQRIAMPVVPSGQNFCDSGTIGDIPVTSVSGATVIWYATETSTTPLPLNTPLVTGNYYVVQTDGVTTSHRVMVPVVINTTPPNLVSQTISLCGSYTFGNLSINNQTGTTVKWYVSQTATTPIGNNVPVVTGTYYVTQSFGTCESQRVPFQITQNESLNKPIAGAQNFCGSGTVANLIAQGTAGAQILWYSSATSTNALSPSTQLSNGTYYVAQTMNGCSSEKRAVAVRVISISAPQISAFTVCGGGTISDLYISTPAETSYKWYLSPSSDFELAQTTPLVQGTYYVERVQYGCVSARAMVQVNIGAVPNPPTGVASQSYVEGSTIANLVLNQSNVVWYASINDSQNGVNALPSYTPLVNGTAYYAVIIGSNGCPSYPFAVTVQVYLSNDEFDKEGLKYYPNPVNDVLNINYVESIRSVEVFDLLGKRVKALNTNEQNIQIDLSGLASGTYMIQLKTDTKTQFIKVIKK
ncbi:fibronectin type III domain-containing protein [Flavobacterium sp. I3-2]|uniref:Ig-like domain-containing protein n=1 Tax=Flavobacterium sp. I3-2 TaxID=2748319 RepID=UPI0015A7AA74|nr:fibronectin type III domain-containing protein [Flavobacterium sp. I3-2]